MRKVALHSKKSRINVHAHGNDNRGLLSGVRAFALLSVSIASSIRCRTSIEYDGGGSQGDRSLPADEQPREQNELRLRHRNGQRRASSRAEKAGSARDGAQILHIRRRLLHR